MQLLLIFSCIAHVEHAGQDHAATEVGEAEEVHQEEEQQQFVGEDQEQTVEQDLTNFVDTQGKHRFIYPRVFHKFKFGASTGSSTPESFISLSLVQAPVHLPQSLT